MPSPFETHQQKVLGFYGTASWLRSVVMALWRGSEQPVGLSQLVSLDAEHFKAFIDMVTHYRQFGENDPAFRKLAQAVEARLEEEASAREKAAQFEGWIANAAHELRKIGKPADLAEDRYNWFEARFEAGDSPQDAAKKCEPLAPLN